MDLDFHRSAPSGMGPKTVPQTATLLFPSIGI
jgi:hypothetical protein